MANNFQSSEQYLNLMMKDKKKHIPIISLFAQTKKMSFDNYEQIERFIVRQTKPAKQLDCYPLQRIKKTMEYLKREADYKWTIETVLKYIDEDLDKLQGEEPIIIHKGEKIYDTNRIIELEAKNEIFYNGKKWISKHN